MHSHSVSQRIADAMADVDREGRRVRGYVTALPRLLSPTALTRTPLPSIN